MRSRVCRALCMGSRIAIQVVAAEQSALGRIALPETDALLVSFAVSPLFRKPMS